jgi:acetoin utilization protein AcuC
MNGDKASVIYHEGIAEYDFGEGYSLRGDRFPRYIKVLEEKGILSRPNVNLLSTQPANDDDLLLVHSREYIKKVKKIADERGFLEEDTPLKPSLIDAVRLIVGAALKAGNLVADKEVKIAQGVGGGLHHAGRDYGGGWCVFNDVAICAQSLIERRGFEKILIIDTDAHCGNGTMDIFYDDPKVLYLSIHQDPHTLYPNTGFVEQIGRGPGLGYTVNIPLPPEANDECLKLVLDSVFKPIVRQFSPQLIIRNGGADPHHLDELAELGYTYNGLWSIGRTVVEEASRAGCGLVDLLCGGYTPGLEEKGLYALFAGELGIKLDYGEDTEPPSFPGVLDKTKAVLKELTTTFKPYWNLET